jgi:hypothetical protein
MTNHNYDTISDEEGEGGGDVSNVALQHLEKSATHEYGKIES